MGDSVKGFALGSSAGLTCSEPVGIVDFSAYPEVMEEYGEFASDSHYRAFFGVLAAAL